MLDDFLAHIFGELAFGRLNNTKRAQLILRLFFGFIGSILAAIGCYHFATSPKVQFSLHLKSSFIGLFFFLGCFCLFNIALGRTWTWPGKLFIATLIAVFLIRILFGP